MSESENDVGARRMRVPRNKMTTAGRLLAAVHESGIVELAEIARILHVPAHFLEECRDGQRALETEVQILLAAAVLSAAPEHARLARQLHAQAQSALRVQLGVVPTHPTYQRASWK